MRSDQRKARAHSSETSDQESDLIKSDQSTAPIGHAIPDAVRDALDRQPGIVFRRVRQRLLGIFPDDPVWSGDWAINSLAYLVAQGPIPETALEKCLLGYFRRIRLGKDPDCPLEPIRGRRGYLGVCLRRLVENHGYEWRNYASDRKLA